VRASGHGRCRRCSWIPDPAFARGLAALEAHCRTVPADREFAEPVDVFVFQR